MISITGCQGFDIFIMQSSENRQKILDLIYKGYDLDSALNYYNLNQSDFTPLDWRQIQQIASDIEY